MNLVRARQLLALAAQSLETENPEATICTVVQAVDIVFLRAVVYDRETGGVCPACGRRGRVTGTDNAVEQTRHRHHYCDHCGKPFRSSEQIVQSGLTPETIDTKLPRRHHRGRKRRN